MLTSVLLTCVAFIGAEAIEGKLTPENQKLVDHTFLTAFCDDLEKNMPIVKALEACRIEKAKEHQEAVGSCIVNTGNGATTFYDYLKASCKNETMTEDFKTCREPYVNNQDFLDKQADYHEATVACYDKAFKDNNVDKVEGIYPKYVKER